jgi:hypothetical protein
MILVETKQSALQIVKGRLTIWVCADRRHKDINAAGPRSAIMYKSCPHMDLGMFGSPQAFRLLPLQPRDCCFQPGGKCRLDLFLGFPQHVKPVHTTRLLLSTYFLRISSSWSNGRDLGPFVKLRHANNSETATRTADGSKRQWLMWSSSKRKLRRKRQLSATHGRIRNYD